MKKLEKLNVLADFIEKLPPRKLHMDDYASLNGSTKLDPFKCKSAACAIGWATRVFPRSFKLEVDTGDLAEMKELKEEGEDVSDYCPTATVIHRSSGETDDQAGAVFFGIDPIHASILFGPEQRGHKTPKQVARNLRYYVEHQAIHPDLYGRR